MVFLIIIMILLSQALCSAGEQPTLEPLYYPPEGTALNFLTDNDGVVYLASQNGFFRSTNSGDSWEHILDRGYSPNMFLHSGNNLTAVVGGYDVGTNPYLGENGYYYTTDKGQSWEFTSDDTVGFIVIDTFHNNTYYKVKFIDPQYNIRRFQFSKSEDRGKTWKVVNEVVLNQKTYPRFFSFLSDSIIIICCDDDSGSHTKGLLIFSSDLGKTWSAPRQLPQIVTQLILYNKKFLLSKSLDSLRISADYGETWQSANLPYCTWHMKYMNDGSFFAACDSGLFYSKDSSFQWKKLSGKVFVKIVVLPNGRIIGNNGYCNFISDDSGRTWRSSMKGFNAAEAISISYSPWGDIYCMDYSFTYRSVDGGMTWDTLPFRYVAAVAYGPDGAEYLCEGLYQASNLYKSLDSGRTWEKLNKDFIFGPCGFQGSIIFSKQGDMFYNAGNDRPGISVSKDWGRTWKDISYIYSNGLCFNTLGHLFAGGAGGCIRRSTDEGESWELLHKDDYNTPDDVTGFVFHPTKPYGYAYGSDMWYGSCLGITGNYGATWSFSKYRFYPCTAGAVDSSGNVVLIGRYYCFVHLKNEDTLRIYNHGYNRIFRDMETAPDGSIYVTEYRGGGVYRLHLDILTGVSFEEVRPSPVFAFPNPASEKVTLSYEPCALPPVLRVCDILGNRVTETALPDGSGSYTLNIDGYAPGVYLYTVSSGGKTNGGKFVVQ